MSSILEESRKRLINHLLNEYDSDDEYDDLKYIVKEMIQSDDEDEPDDPENRFHGRYGHTHLSDFYEKEIEKRRLTLTRTELNGLTWLKHNLQRVKIEVKTKILQDKVKKYRLSKKQEVLEKKRLLMEAKFANETKAAKKLRLKLIKEKEMIKAVKRKEDLFAAKFRKCFKKK